MTLNPRAARIIDAVCAYYGASADQVRGPHKTKHVSFARHACMYLLRQVMHYRFEDIAVALGGRHHSTVIYGVKQIERLMATDQQTRTQIAYLLNHLTHEPQRSA